MDEHTVAQPRDDVVVLVLAICLTLLTLAYVWRRKWRNQRANGEAAQILFVATNAPDVLHGDALVAALLARVTTHIHQIAFQVRVVTSYEVHPKCDVAVLISNAATVADVTMDVTNVCASIPDARARLLLASRHQCGAIQSERDRQRLQLLPIDYMPREDGTVAIDAIDALIDALHVALIVREANESFEFRRNCEEI